MSKPFVRDSVEYFKFSLTERDGQDLTTNTVQCAIELPGVVSPTWLDCIWETATTWRTSNPITFSEANYPQTAYRAWARVVDAPETPWVSLGRVNIQER